MSGRWLFRLGAGILILAAVVHVSTVWSRVAGMAGVLPAGKWMFVAGFAISAATALAACGLAALLLWKAPDRPDARALTLFLSFLAIFWGSIFRFMDVSAETRSININLSYGSGWISKTALVSAMLAIALFLRFSALFPVPLDMPRLPPSRLPRFVRRIRVASLRPVPVYAILVFLVLLQNFTIPIVSRLIGADSLAPDAAPPPLWMVLGAIGLVLLIRFASLDADVLGLAFPLALVLAPLVAVLGACAGVLYSGAIDPALALEKSTVYGILGAVGIVAFAGIENALSNLVEDRLRLPGFVGAMIAGTLVTLALVPVRKSISSWVRVRSPHATPPTSTPDVATAPPEAAPATARLP